MAMLDVQKKLQALGFDPGPLDGLMGPKTEAAIMAFQGSHGLAADGIVGPRTLAALGLVPPAPDKWIYMLDVSAYQAPVDFEKVKAAGYEAIAIKATEGIGTVDRPFFENWKNAKSAGLPRFAYHFFHPIHDGGDQADFFLQTLGGDLGEIVAVLDWETADKVSPTGQIAQAEKWFGKLDAAYTDFAAKPFVYSYSAYLSLLKLPDSFASRPLWLAGYVDYDKLVIPSPWTAFDLWQYRSDYTPSAPGISDKLEKDFSKYPGTIDDFLARYGRKA